jgi:hypothetical protein
MIWERGEGATKVFLAEATCRVHVRSKHQLMDKTAPPVFTA